MQSATEMFKTLTKIVKSFGIPGEAHSFKILKGGNINDTYDLDMLENGKIKSYIVQRINANVFTAPYKVMENFDSVTRHMYNKLRQRGESDVLRKTLKLYHRSDGSSLFVDNDGNYWRVISCVYNATSLDFPTIETIKSAGIGFANFQKELDDYPIDNLHETIPNFHNTPKRLSDFWKAVEADAVGRVSSISNEISWIKKREKYASYFMDLYSKNEIKLRVTHNDTKCNNIMIDKITSEPLAVIDLDTVMPGFAAYDFGDAIRSAAATAPEDETNLDNMKMDFEMFKAFSEGYIPPLKNILTETELNTLPYGALVMTYELSIRFLTDYINGDTYFKTYRPEHNLDRTRAQMKLLESMEEQLDNMCSAIKEIIKNSV